MIDSRPMFIFQGATKKKASLWIRGIRGRGGGYIKRLDDGIGENRQGKRLTMERYHEKGKKKGGGSRNRIIHGPCLMMADFPLGPGRKIMVAPAALQPPPEISTPSPFFFSLLHPSSSSSSSPVPFSHSKQKPLLQHRGGNDAEKRLWCQYAAQEGSTENSAVTVTVTVTAARGSSATSQVDDLLEDGAQLSRPFAVPKPALPPARFPFPSPMSSPSNTPRVHPHWPPFWMLQKGPPVEN